MICRIETAVDAGGYPAQTKVETKAQPDHAKL